jgi:Swt1-like HEPN
MTQPQEPSLYEFVYRGILADEALDAAGRTSRTFDSSEHEIAVALSLDLFDAEDFVPAHRMSIVYAAIAAFENSVRKFIYKVLIDVHGESWWENGVSGNIRKLAESRREEEEKTRWHGVRGDDLLSYTEMGHLSNILSQNWEHFEPYVRRMDWATAILATIERSRNVIMHSGHLAMPDIERIGIQMRDWNKQVGL